MQIGPSPSARTSHSLLGTSVPAVLVALGLALWGSACTETAHVVSELAAATPIESAQQVASPEAEAEGITLVDDDLAAERAALEAERVRVEALRAQLAEAEQARDAAAANRPSKPRRPTTTRTPPPKTPTPKRPPIVLDPDDGNPL